LAPRVSPKKTWEGAIGSTIAAIVFGGLMGQFAPELTSALVRVHLASAPVASRAPFWQTALLAFPMTVAAQLGDLVESVFKRGAGVKDSGALLPGHGGVLDRIDAMLLAIPVLWYYLTLRA
jgi:phosphatidate cytidylyltransferase